MILVNKKQIKALRLSKTNISYVRNIRKIEKHGITWDVNKQN